MDCEFSERERSREEDAELKHSMKKSKESKGSPAFTAPSSYRDKLVGEIPGAFAQAFNLLSAEEGDAQPNMDVEDVNKGLLAVNLSSDTRKHIRAKWAHTHLLSRFLADLWDSIIYMLR